MRKNVSSRKETKDQRNSPMWYTAAAEYSRKKCLADRLAACKQEVAAFEKRIRSYSQEMEMYPISRSPPRARSISPSNQFRGCVVPTPRFDGGTTRSRPRCRSKTPTTGLRNVATATARPLDRFVSSTSRSLSPPRRGQRKSYPSRHGLASTSTIKRNNLKEPSTSRASSSASESDDDNENQPQVIDVTSKASQRATNIAQLIMVKPSRRSIMSVKKAISMQKLRMTSGSVPNRLSKASKKTIASVPVEQPDESDVSVKAPVEAEQQESIQETVLETEAEPEPEPKVPSARQSESTSERQSKVDSQGPDVQYYSTSERELDSVVDGQQEEVPDIEIFHCYPNECQGGTGGPSSIICGECNGNGTSNLINQARGNVLRSCSVTEEHFISFNSDSELHPNVNLPQYGISHYMYPGCEGQVNWHSNMPYSYGPTMLQSQPGQRMSYGCNRPGCRQQQLQQQQGQQNAYNMWNPQQHQHLQQQQQLQQQQLQQQQLQQQQLQQQHMQQQQQLQQQQFQLQQCPQPRCSQPQCSQAQYSQLQCSQQQCQQQQQQNQQQQSQQPPPQQDCLTELLAQQLQKQMEQAQAQIAQVQLQLYNVCGAAKMSKPPSFDATEVTTLPQQSPVDEELPTISGTQSASPCQNLGKSNVTFCSQATVGQALCCNEAPAVMPLGLCQTPTEGCEQMNQPQPQQLQQQQFLQLQQQQQQQQQQFLQQQATFQQPAPQCSGNTFWTPCCRQRYAQMRFMMPRPRCCDRHRRSL